MKKFYIIYVSKRVLFCVCTLIVAAAAVITVNLSAKTFNNSHTRTIIIDPGHGGIDGGTSKNDILEKDINLDIAKRLRIYLKQKGYEVAMTRDKDKSLESLSNKTGSRHLKDLNARTYIINNSNAQLFMSIHTNCHTGNSYADGSLVLFNGKFFENKTLAYCVQRALNNITIDGIERTIHNPQYSFDFYLLNYSKIPGVIIETAFISNQKEWELLQQDNFKNQIAKAIADGMEKFFKESRNKPKLPAKKVIKLLYIYPWKKEQLN
jgi:N-acetylmuramoyl-L-alanine amidase